MPANSVLPLDALPSHARSVLTDLVAAARDSFQDHLSSIILFGSAAEGRLRPTSDLNLVIVLTEFDKKRVDSFREPMRMAHVAVRATAMFIKDTELEDAVALSPVKFGDIARRHLMLFGTLPAAFSTVSQADQRRQLREMLMNLSLRLRQTYVLTSLRPEQLAKVIANCAGPLRSAAFTLLELEGSTASSPKAALETLAAILPDAPAGQSWQDLCGQISRARETGQMAPDIAGPTLFDLIALTAAMRGRVELAS
ncbi:MAG: nucleotidyltransferase domain-containing protein [Alphaproteobacteria bacterium]|nr:nucleotidyltransferase domain-containing protein [Alphaproteobacteria bacterium]